MFDKSKNNEELVDHTHLNKYSEKAINNLNRKKENPFWMPSHNADIFEVRDILRQEKDLKRAINRTKQKQKQPVEKETQGGTIEDNSTNIYLTEQRVGTNYNEFVEKFNKFKNGYEKVVETVNTVTHINELAKLAHNNSGTNLLSKIAEQKEKEAKKETIGKDLLQKKIDSIGGKRKDNVRDYINKTRELILIKYSIDVKKERAVRLEETYNNEIESIKDSIMSMEEAKKLFENEFYVKFEQYVKFLMKQKEHEKNEETNLLESKMKLDAEKSKLANKISKLEKEKKNYEECQHFMIRVKEKILVIPEHLKTATGLISKDNTNPYFTSLPESNSFLKKIKNSSNINIPNEERERFEKIRGYFNGATIFESPKDLLDEIKKMENDNVKKLSQYNEFSYDLREADKEFQRIREDEKKTYDTNITEIMNKERQVKILKDKFKQLNEEKQNLIGENPDFIKENNNNSNKRISKHKQNSLKNKFSEPQLFSKILEVFKSTNELETNSKNEIEIGKKNTDLEMNMLIMLKYIEKSCDYLITKYFEYSKNSSIEHDLKKIELDLDQQRKQKKAHEMKIQYFVDEQRKRKENEEKMNRIYVIPKRKIPERCPPKDLDDKNKRNDKDDNKELNFEDFIDF